MTCEGLISTGWPRSAGRGRWQVYSRASQAIHMEDSGCCPILTPNQLQTNILKNAIKIIILKIITRLDIMAMSNCGQSFLNTSFRFLNLSHFGPVPTARRVYLSTNHILSSNSLHLYYPGQCSPY